MEWNLATGWLTSEEAEQGCQQVQDTSSQIPLEGAPHFFQAFHDINIYK